MALRKGVHFKEIDKDFKSCGKITESPVESNSKENQSKRKGVLSKTAKKTKVDGKNQNVQGTSTKESDDNEEELENLKSSYVLTMSQSVCRDGSNDDATENSEYIFETIDEVCCVNKEHILFLLIFNISLICV